MTYPDRIRANELFKDEIVEVDGFVFHACQFDHCKIVYRGDEPVKFEDCLFESCEWVFNGPGENVLLYLSALYNGLGEGGRELVESIFESIRRGTVMEGVQLQQATLRR